MLNGEQVNDPIEEDDHTDNIVGDDGTNTLIHVIADFTTHCESHFYGLPYPL